MDLLADVLSVSLGFLLGICIVDGIRLALKFVGIFIIIEGKEL